MQIYNLGHACFLVKDGRNLIISDPWSNNTIAMENSWLPFPPSNPEKLFDLVKKNENVFVWLSHEHSDHYDLKFMQKLCHNIKKVHFILPDYGSHSFKGLKKLFSKNKIISLSENENFKIDNLNFKFLFEKPIFAEHCAAIIENEKIRFINMNDAVVKDFDLKLKDKDKYIIYTGQYSSVSPYPEIDISMTYKNKKKLQKNHIISQINRFTDGIKDFEADMGIPSAGPALMFPTTDYISHNKRLVTESKGPFDRNYLNKIIKSKLPKNKKVIFLDVNEKIDFNNLKNIRNHFYKKKELSKIYNDIIKKHLHFDNKIFIYSDESIKQLLIKFSNNLIKIYRKLDLDFSVVFDIFVSDKNFKSEIFFSKDNLKYEIMAKKKNSNVNSKTNYYSIYLKSRSINRLIKNKISFEEFWYGGHILVSQTSGGYQPDLINILNLMHSKKLINDYQNYLDDYRKKSMSLKYNGKKFILKRFCPHRGADLSACKPNKLGHIKCPAHGWVFSVETGQCLKGNLKSNINYE